MKKPPRKPLPPVAIIKGSINIYPHFFQDQCTIVVKGVGETRVSIGTIYDIEREYNQKHPKTLPFGRQSLETQLAIILETLYIRAQYVPFEPVSNERREDKRFA